MAQYRMVEVTLSVKKSAVSGNTYPTNVVDYVEMFDNVASLKSIQDGLCADVMATCVSMLQGARFDTLTGERIKVTYSIRARIVGTVSAAGTSKEAGANAVKKGKKMSKNARRRAARYGK